MALQTSAGFTALARIFEWMKTPLRHGFFRVNTLRADPEEVLGKARLFLAEEASRQGCAPPTAFLHPVLREALVFSAWPDKVALSAPLPERSDLPVVIVDVSCANAVLRGAPIFKGGVLAISEKASVGDTVSVYGFREGSRSWIGYGKLQLFPPTFKNRPQAEVDSKINYDCVVEIEEGLPVLPPAPRGLVEAGMVVQQSLPSMLTSRVLNPQPGERILDLGCGNGFMTTHLAAITKNEAELIAVDHSLPRISALVRRCELLGANVEAVHAEAEDFAAGECAKFDRIVVHPDHSSVGVRPSLEDLASRGRGVNLGIRSYVDLAVNMLKPGGHLVYCTGSAMPLENDGVLRWLLDRRRDMRLVPAEPQLAQVGVPSPLPVTAWMRLSPEEEKWIQRFGPCTHDMVPDPVIRDAPSFFIAHLVKKH